ncbi:uncharacterized protein MYCFIDRAFT_203653 [Pseudocercospora fijiensis CIRAD86]|uniref:Importin N-terminal domain-containing protein n=1 Tax=Pseudocercospora fijiensis (strain CIRAD86) TaxID=383855 RepID=M3B234_PSEFD|nr:uncharacterized protein MYCFIDRAFT_203653 [Pseudocercospora fijiensis CIRAD86]EME83472.1 hypothetical protein MYCFIDRAFT_203653 [Pseudocercospora fijiensis CIRAD86]
MARVEVVAVPGEANPLTEAQIVHTLQSAASSDPIQIQSGTKQLVQWEKTPLFYRHLQSAYLASHLPVEVRYLAIIQLKNGIDKYWRKTALNAVPKDDKDVIRGRLVESTVQESDNRLALQAALVAAKIARYEFPSDWPDAISSFLRILQSNATPSQSARSLLALLHIVKELSTGRLQRTRQHLQAAAPEIVAVVGNAYANIVAQWRETLNVDSMHQSLLAIKLLRRLFISGYEHPNRDSAVTSFWNLSLEHVSAFLPLLGDHTLSADSARLVGRHTLQLSKMHHEMARDHPAAFALLPDSLQLTLSYWALIKDFGSAFGSREAVASASGDVGIGSDGDASDEKPFVEKISLKGMLILRACVKMVHNPTNTFKYRSPEDKEEKNRATETIKQTLLIDPFVREVMEVLVTKFFVFRASDLKEWLEEPEEWEKREEGDGEDWEFSVRSCSEKLFLDLAINYKEIIVEPLLNVFYSVANPGNENVLFKDSVYTAIGLSASVLYQHLDFDTFIRDVLVQEVQKSSAGFNILRRRIAILLGRWISVKVSHDSRPIVYQIFQHLLNDEDALNDQVVRVTAGRQLANIANDWEFQVEQFLPYAQTILTQLMTLIGEVELTETKMALLNTISVIVERLDQHVTPYAERIVSLLPGLWEQSGEEHLMKQAILTILARLVTAMKEQSLPLHPMVLPIIKGAVEPGSETQIYLMDEALDLWSNVLQQTPAGSASPELLNLVQYLYPIYELGSENLRTGLMIAKSYVLAAPQYMLSAPVRADMFRSLVHLLKPPSVDLIGLVCGLLETMLRMAQRPDVASGLPLGQFSNASAMIIFDLANVTNPDAGNFGLLQKLLDGLHSAWSAHCTTGPNRKYTEVKGIVETDYFAVLSRAILGSLDSFLHSCQKAASDVFGGATLEDTMKWLLEEWSSHIEDVGDPSRKKLMCLAMTKLLETNQSFILLQLQSLMTIWTDLIVELREDEADTSGDSLVYGDDGPNTEWGPESPEETRNRAMTATDEVHTIKVPDFVKHYLQQAITAAGGYEKFQEQWLVNVDQDVVKAFAKLGVM